MHLKWAGISLYKDGMRNPAGILHFNGTVPLKAFCLNNDSTKLNCYYIIELDHIKQVWYEYEDKYEVEYVVKPL